MAARAFLQAQIRTEKGKGAVNRKKKNLQWRLK